MKPDEVTIKNCSAVLLLILTLAIPLGAEAKTLYVNTATGNDSTTYASNGVSNPWKTIGRAARGTSNYSSPNASEAARAGDTVLIADGIYWETGDPNGRRWDVVLNSTNSGTSGNPIIFRGVGLVYIRLNNGVHGPMIGCNTRNYITWDNVQINDYYGGSMADTGPVVFFNSQNCQLINSDVRGHTGSYYWGYATFVDNYNAVRGEASTFITIKNNRLHDITTASGGSNQAGIMLYSCADTLIEHNEIYNNGMGMYIKGKSSTNNTRAIIRYNLVRNNGTGIKVNDADDTHVYQNILLNNTVFGFEAGNFAALRSRFINNTLYGTGDTGILLNDASMVDVHFKNNLVVTSAGNAVGSWNQTTPASQNVVLDRNLYYNNRNFASYSPTISFGTWQGTYRQDPTSLNGPDPLFVASGTDFHLRAGSPALPLGVDVLDLNNNGITTDTIPVGAYITGNEVIGLTSGSSTPDTTAPQPPGNLQVCTSCPAP